MAMAIVFKMHWFSRWRMEWTLGCPMGGEGKCAKVGGNVGVFQFLDGGHVEVVVVADGVR